MPPHDYLRVLARVLGRQPRLGPPPGVNFKRASAQHYARLMPYTHPISGHRGRSFEQRHLELWVADFPEQSRPARSHLADQATKPPISNKTSGPVASDSHSHSVGVPSNPGLDPHASPTPHHQQNPRTPARSPSTAPNPPTAPYHPLQSTPTCGCGTDPSAPADRALDNARHSTVEAATQTPTEEAPVPGSATPPTRTQPAFHDQRHQHHGRHQHHPPSHHPNSSHHQSPQAPPPHSYLEIRYPFSTQPTLWQAYLRSCTTPTGTTATTTVGSLDLVPFIEDFDTIAADVAARHVGGVPDSMLVTACMERFTWHLHPGCEGDRDPDGEGEGEKDPDGEGLAAAAATVVGENSTEGGHGSSMAVLAPVDMHLAGQVTWVGRSSMEVLLQLTVASPSDTSPPPPAPAHVTTASSAPPPPPEAPGVVRLKPGQLVASAEFLMALRDTSLRRAVEVPPLHPLSALERELFRRGRERQHERQMRRKRDDGTHVGTAGAAAAATEATGAVRDSSMASGAGFSGGGGVAERSQDAVAAVATEPLATLHSHGRKRGRGTGSTDKGVTEAVNGTSESISPAVAAQPQSGEGLVSCEAAPLTVPIPQTEIHRTVVARHEDRNTSGTVFGGHLLRLGYEQAAAAAEAFVGVPCELLWLEEGAISAPARVGDELHVSGRVVWTDAGGQVLRIVAHVWRQGEGSHAQQVSALTLAAAFLAPEGSRLRAVVPTESSTEAEALAAKRRHAVVMAALEREETQDGNVLNGP